MPLSLVFQEGTLRRPFLLFFEKRALVGGDPPRSPPAHAAALFFLFFLFFLAPFVFLFVADSSGLVERRGRLVYSECWKWQAARLLLHVFLQVLT